LRTTKQRAAVAKKLRKVPAVAAKSVVTLSKRDRSPKNVVQGVQDELGALLTRGYSVEEVGRELRGAGIEISAGTLRSYARGAKRTSDATTSPAAPAKRKPATRKTAAAKNAPVSAAASRKISTPPVAAAKGRVAGSDFQLAKATFVVRPDTPDSDL
jgi:hypothetical protein